MRGAGYIVKLAWRLLWPQRSVLRVVTAVCVLGVALGVMLQIVVRGVMDGMVDEIDAGVTSCVPALLIKSHTLQPEAVADWPGVKTCVLVAMGRGMVKGENALYASWADLVGAESLLVAGRAIRSNHEVIVSKAYAEKMQLHPGQKLLLSLPGGGSNSLQVSGVFRVPGRMLVPDVIGRVVLDGCEELLAIESAPGVAPETLLQMVTTQDASALVVDGSGGSGDWLSLIAKVKRVMGVVLFSATLIASFATGGLMLVICLTHRRLMAVLYAYGVSRVRLSLLYIAQGVIVATLGVMLGVLLGLLVLNYRMQVQAMLMFCGLNAFPTEVLDMELPARAPLSLYIIQAAVAWCIVVLASLPGAWVASRCRSMR